MASRSVSPESVGRFKVEAILGSGGMGEVYKAIDPTLQRIVAVKTVRPDISNPEYLDRLVREAQACASLQHPNIVTVYEAGKIDGAVVGVLGEQGSDPQAGGTMAWHNVNLATFVPLPTLTGRTLDLAPDQPVDEIWLQVADGERAPELGKVLQRALARTHKDDEFTIVVPRQLLAQRYRTQRTFSVVIGSVAVLALLVGGIGIMNIMLTSVVERTREIGVRRTSGAKRRDITMQFLIETLLMTVSGGVAGIIVGAGVSIGISTYAGWKTHVSPTAVLLAFVVSFVVGLVFGLYPAMKAAALEPVDAMRYE